MEHDHDEIVERMLVPPGSRVKLKDHDPDWLLTRGMESIGKDKAKEASGRLLDQSREDLIRAQELLYATGRQAVLIMLQGRDASGKDGVIKHAMSGVNPQGCEVHSFKVPTQEEHSHDFLWRYRRFTPGRGRIGIFNRSYYEDVLVVRVHPDLLDEPKGKPDRSFWERRFEAIRALEELLVHEGTLVLKFFLNVSKSEQKKRLLDRLDDPDKHWKFSPGDLAERACWDEYTTAFEEAFGATSTKKAPWYVVPADHKWVARAAVVAITAHAIRSLSLRFPEPTPEQIGAMAAARAKLEAD